MARSPDQVLPPGNPLLDFLNRMANLYQLHTDWCVRCGAEHSYMAGPCNKCGGKVFKKNPAVR